MDVYEGAYWEYPAEDDKVLVLQDGTVAMYDTTENVFARADELLELGLSVPHSSLIAMALKAEGVELEGAVHTIEGLKAAILARKGVGRC